MHILDVVPIQKGIQHETLSYFSAKPVAVGSLVTVPVRKKGIPSIVVAVHDVASLKADVRNADFQLRNILSIHKNTLFMPEFVRMCVLLKNYYVNTTGSLLSLLTPQLFLDEFIESVPAQSLTRSEDTGLIPERFIFQASETERMSTYKTMTREAFATGNSLFILCPNLATIEKIAQELEKGVKNRVVVFHSGLSKKKLRENMKIVLESEQPLALIGTISYLCIPRADIKTLIIEHEGSSHYVSMQRPYLDARVVAMTYAHLRGLTLIVADTLLQFSTLWRARDEHWDELKPLSFHIDGASRFQKVSLQKSDDDKEKKQTSKKFELFDPAVEKNIQKALEENKKILCYVARKGLAPLTLCQDCGEILRSPESGRPLVLYRKGNKTNKEKAVYQCPVTHTLYNTIDQCQECGSWKLKLLGVGVETVAKYLELIVPATDLYVVDSSQQKTHAQTKKVCKRINEQESCVVITTEKILPYLSSKSFDDVVIVSLDSLFSLSSYRMTEEILRRMMRLSEVSKNQLILQTRIPDEKLFTEYEKGNMSDAYRADIADRELFRYPPFGTLIVVESTTTQASVPRKKRELEKLFEEHSPTVLVRPSTKKGSFTVRVVIKLGFSDWISPRSAKNPPEIFRKLFPLLKNLRPSYSIKINPESV